jgi:hypothetical protein
VFLRRVRELQAQNEAASSAIAGINSPTVLVLNTKGRYRMERPFFFVLNVIGISDKVHHLLYVGPFQRTLDLHTFQSRSELGAP